MATVSNSSRGLLTGMASSGGVLRVSTAEVLLHVCVDARDEQADTIYVFAYSIASPAPGRAATIEIGARERDGGARATELVSIEIPEAPHAPVLVLNGMVKSNAARIYARAPRSDVAVFGFYTRQALSTTPAANTTVGSLVLLHQTLSVSAARESAVINANIPVTFIASNHTSSVPSNAYLGQAREGAYKIVTLVSKHPNALGDAGDALGNVRVAFNRFRLPDNGDSNRAVGTLLFQRVGDSAQLLYSSAIGWMIVGSGVTVE